MIAYSSSSPDGLPTFRRSDVDSLPCHRIQSQRCEPFVVYSHSPTRKEIAVRFVRNASFPAAKCSFTAAGTLWKMDLREWAFADVDLDLGTVPSYPPGPPDVTSNNPGVVPPAMDPDGIASVWTVGTANMTSNFYAKTVGFTFIQPYRGNPFVALGGLVLQVEVKTRRASSPASISLTKLLGTTVALNAPDAISYEMDTTTTLSSSETNPANIAALLPAGTNHLVIGSHGGFLGTAGSTRELCMFAWGVRSSIRLGVHNVELVFSAIKPKMADDAVIWLGGCNIGENNEFCQKAADSSGRTVIAATNPLQAMRFRKGTVDLVDRYAGPKVFEAGGKTPVAMNVFCAKQKRRKFEVPV